MSATDAGQPLDIQEQVARIRRAQVETDKLAEETRKFVAEQHKLTAEAQKFRREQAIAPWQIAPWQLAILFTGSIGGFFAGAVALWHTLGH